MKHDANRRVRVRQWGPVATSVVALAAAGVAGCGDGDRASRSPVAKEGGAIAEPEYALSATITDRNGTRKVKFLPTRGRLSASAELPEDAVSALAAIIDTEDGETIDTSTEEEANGYAPGSVLMKYAVASCVAIAEQSLTSDWTWPSEVSIPWHTNGLYYAFDNQDPLTCDEFEMYQEMVLCAANRLDEIADITAPIDWTLEVLSDRGFGAHDQVTIHFDPQRSWDVFIARDLALNALGHYVFAETQPPPGGLLPGRTCLDAYLDLADGVETSLPSGLETPAADVYFGVHDLDTGNATDVAEWGRRRVARKLTTLGAAASLLRTATEAQAQADLAEALRRRAKVEDARRGIQLMWGYAPESESEYGASQGYGTLRHALNTIAGRLELDFDTTGVAWTPERPANVPTCRANAGRADELMESDSTSYGVMLSVRPPASDAEARALSAVSEAGIIIPASFHREGHDKMERVRDQLVMSAVGRTGVTAGPTFDAARAAAEEFADEDLSYALTQVWLAFRLFSGVGENPPVEMEELAENLGLTLAEPQNVVSELAAMLAIVVEGGFPGATSEPSPWARYAYTARNAQCPLGYDMSSENLGFDYRFAMQGAVGAGQAASRTFARAVDRLVTIPGLEDARAYATTSLSETQQWAGRFTVFYQRDAATGEIGAVIAGTTNELWPGISNEEFATRLVVASGTSVAQCAEGTRSVCPTDLADQVHEPSTISLGASEPECLGNGRACLALHFNDSNQPLLVLRAGDDGQPGSILGWLGGDLTPGSTATRVLPVSQWQQDLVNSTFRLRERESVSPRCSEWELSMNIDSYCIKGVEQDQYIPLGNDLTGTELPSPEDVWQYYLERADLAAHEADQLGKELIERGLNLELREEAAIEEAAEICGAFPLADEIEVDENGSIVATGSAELDACVNEDTYDVLSLAELRSTVAQSWTSEWLRNEWCVEDDDVRNPPFCSKFVDNDGNPVDYEVEAETLELAVPGGSDTPSPDECKAFIEAFGSDLNHAQQQAMVAGLGWKSYATRNGFRASLGALRLERPGVDGNWILYVYNEPVMASYHVAGVPDEDMYPYCRTLGGDPDEGCSDEAQAWKAFFIYNIDYVQVYDAIRFGDALEGAIWAMGALAGHLPMGVILKNVPVQFGDAAHPLFQYSPCGVEQVPGSTDYALSTCDDDGHQEVTSLDRAMMARLWEVAPDALNALALGTSDRLVRHIWHSFQGEESYRNADGNLFLKWSANGEIIFEDPFWVLIDGHYSQWSRDILHEYYPAMVQDIVWNSNGDASGAPSVDPLSVLSGAGLCAAGDGGYGFVNRDQAGAEMLGLHQYEFPTAGADDSDDDALARISAANDAFATAGSHCSANTPTMVEAECLAMDRLGPAACPAWVRMPYFLNRNPRFNGQHEDMDFMRAVALSCKVATHEVTLRENEPPPPIDSVDDIVRLEIWTGRVAQAVDDAIRKLVLFDVPKVVVNDFLSGAVGTGATGNGAHGAALVRLGQALESIHSGWVGVSSAFRKLSGAIQSARLGMQAGSAEYQLALIDVARQRLDLQRQMALESLGEIANLLKYSSGIIQGVAAQSPLSLIMNQADAMLAIETALINHNFLQSMEELAGDEQVMLESQASAEAGQILAQLGLQSVEIYEGMQQALGAIRTSTGDAINATIELRQGEDAARLALAKASGSRFVETQSGQVPLAVSSVLSRLYSAERLRYWRALQRAKRAAYVARLAIEQRIGVRLNTLEHWGVLGSSEPPAVWADDVCGLVGVRFEDLVSAEDTPFGVEEGAYANQFVGDYVNKLREFVEFYNMEYPSRAGADTAVVSLRDDVGAADATCVAESGNLLCYSDQLHSGGGVDEAGAATGGWAVTDCGDVCLTVAPVLIGVDGQEREVSPPDDTGAVSWLMNEAPAVVSDGEDARPRNTVYQTVELVAGRGYTLSWWDMVMPRDGAENWEGSVGYVAAIYSDQWVPVATSVESVVGAAAWSDRRGLSYAPAVSGKYHVAFASSAVGNEVALGIANVQVESSSYLSGATGYVQTTGSRMVVTQECQTVAPGAWRSMFSRVCDSDGCYYVLNQPIAIDSEAISLGLSPLSRRFAPGNINYRHGSVAANLVGTGVLDCSQESSQSCYGSGYVEFELEHLAASAKILNAATEPQCFDFKRGAIRGGKALATERFITNPVSSADRALLEQSGFRKAELAGRPLSGLYQLKFKDSPALRWDRVEDVQLVFDYSYWSEVDALTN